MLFLENEYEGYLVHVLVFHQFLVTLEQDLLRVDNSYHFHGLAEILNWHGLDTQNVIRVKQGLKVILI